MLRDFNFVTMYLEVSAFEQFDGGITSLQAPMIDDGVSFIFLGATEFAKAPSIIIINDICRYTCSTSRVQQYR